MAFGADIFIDFQTGRDSNSGTTKEAPWQHAPGDPNATEDANDYILKPGDTVYFKGGVEYLGNIVIADDGAPGKPITYNGNGWGEKRATISGAKELDVALAPCASQSACYDNPNWQKLYISKLKDPIDPLSVVFLGEERLWLAREPNQPDPFWFDDIAHYSVIDGFGKELTSSSLTIGSDLKDLRPENWSSALVGIWMKPNVVLMRPVQKIDGDSGTIYFEPVSNKPYTDRDSYFAFFNRPSDIDQPGEYVIDNNARNILYWPKDPALIKREKLHVNQLAAGFNINGKSNITITGFKITNYFGGLKGWAAGAGVINVKKNTQNLVVRDNVISHLKSAEGVGAIQLHHVENAVIENNMIVENEKNSGIRFGHSKNIVIRKNVIKRIGRTGIRLIETENVEVSGNYLTSIHGGHGNGMSVYLKNKNILVADNIIEDTPSAFTYHGTGKENEAENLWLLNNIFLGRVNSWGKNFSSVVILHNLFLAPNERKKALRIPSDELKTVVKNNIIDGFLIKPMYHDWDVSDNLYTSLSWTQSIKYHWSMEEGGEINEDIADKIFQFIKSKHAVDRPNGENISAYLPTNLFKTYDFSYWSQNRPVGPNLIPAK